MGFVRYLPAYAIGALILWGVLDASIASLAVVAVLFGGIPLVEQLLPQSTVNLTREQEKARLAQHSYEWLLYGLVPVQFTVVGLLIVGVASGTLHGWGLVGAVLAAGSSCAGLAINVAHELGHRRERLPRFLSQALLFSTLYMHFFIEHNRGHHVRVATPEDPASSRRGEILYAFWLRSVVGGFRSAWSLEAQRVERQGASRWSWSNMVVRYGALQLGALAAVTAIAGPLAAAAWMAASLMGILILESINYVEHYGLQRRMLPNGRYEPVRPIHSWNTNHALGRVLLFELTRHSDHHENPLRRYPVLRHFDHAPQLPMGYPGAVVLSLIPPLYFAVMEPKLRAWETAREQAGEAPASQPAAA